MPDYGRRLLRLESWGAGGADECWRAASPWRQLNLPQIRLEPLLKARAEELSPGRIRFNHELIDLEQDDDGVRALIRDNGSGREYIVRCEYLLGADGGRSVHRLIGVEYEGLGVVTQTATLHVSADFSPWAKDPDVLIRWIYSPQSRRPGGDGPDGSRALGPRVGGVGDPPELPGRDRAETDAQVEADVRRALGIADLPMEIHKITRWSVDAVIASAFRVGRVFLVGDAAHRHPPTGGLGLTSAIHDAQNLCWKLAAVLAGNGIAGPARHLRGRAAAGRCSATASARWRTRSTTSRSGRHWSLPGELPGAEHEAAAAGAGATGRKTPSPARPCCAGCARSRWSSRS